MPQPKAMAKYQRGKAKRFITQINDNIRADLDAAKSAFEEKIGQRCSYAVLFHRMARLTIAHMATASAISERDLLMDLIARGEVIKRETKAGPTLVINLARLRPPQELVGDVIRTTSTVAVAAA
jgi:hypothetical protein